MKTKLVLAFLLLTFAYSCKKDANSSLVIGKWRTTEILFTANMSEPLYIQFMSPARVQSTFFSDCTGYSISGDNLTLKFTGAADLTQLSFTYSIKGDTLILNQNNCSSGCNLSFVKE